MKPLALKCATFLLTIEAFLRPWLLRDALLLGVALSLIAFALFSPSERDTNNPFTP